MSTVLPFRKSHYNESLLQVAKRPFFPMAAAQNVGLPVGLASYQINHDNIVFFTFKVIQRNADRPVKLFRIFSRFSPFTEVYWLQHLNNDIKKN